MAGEKSNVRGAAPSAPPRPTLSRRDSQKSETHPEVEPDGPDPDAPPRIQTQPGLPPPPPSARPVSERPKAEHPGSLPPPLSARAPRPSLTPATRPNLPAAPPVPQISPPPPASADLSRLETEVESLRKRLSAQHQETRTAQRNADRLRAELAQMRTEKEKLELERAAWNAERSARPDTEPPPPLSRPSQWPALQRANNKHSEEILRLRAEHRLELDRVRSHHATELANLKKSLFSKHASNDETATLKLQELEEKYEARLQALRERLRESEHQGGPEKVDELSQALAEERAKSEELSRRIQELESAQEKASILPHPASMSKADDLTQLKGVGPKLAEALIREGVHSLGQIAAFSDEDLEALAPKIKFSAARMKKNDWVRTARRLIS